MHKALKEGSCSTSLNIRACDLSVSLRNVLQTYDLHCHKYVHHRQTYSKCQTVSKVIVPHTPLSGVYESQFLKRLSLGICHVNVVSQSSPCLLS